MWSQWLGIDWGNEWIKAVELDYRSRKYRLLRWAVFHRSQLPAEHPEIWLVEQLRQQGFTSKEAALSLSGKDCLLRYVRIPPITDWRIQLMLQYEIQSLEENSPYEIVGDSMIIRVPEYLGEEQLGIIAITRGEDLEQRLEAFQSAGLVIRQVLPASLALQGIAQLLHWEWVDPILAIDIGRHTIDLAFFERGKLLFSRSLSIGSEVWIRTLMEEEGLSESEALQWLSTQGSLAPEKAGKSRRHQLLLSATERLAGGIHSAINLAKTHLEVEELPLEKIFLSGGGANLPGLDRFLASTFECEVSLLPTDKLDTTPHLGTQKEKLHKLWPQLALPVSLTITSASSLTSLNLLPESWKKRYIFWHQHIYLLAAAVLLLGFVLLGFAVSMTVQSKANQLWQAALAEEEKARELEQQWKRLKQENQKQWTVAKKLNQMGFSLYSTLMLLDTLQSSLPGGVYLRRLSLISRDYQRGTLQFQLLCRADNSHLKAADKIGKLKNALEKLPFVQKVQISAGLAVSERPHELQYTLQVQCISPSQ